MNLESKDIISIIALIGVFVLIAIGKITWEQGSAIITLIVGVYIGYRFGYVQAQSEKAYGKSKEKV